MMITTVAGISTALSLLKVAPALAARTLVLEKARHPRHKLCGGGVTFLADPLLDRLDIGWDRLGLAHEPIHALKLRFGDREVILSQRNVVRIIRRQAFDARLVTLARERGIEMREGMPLTGLQRVADGVLLQTPGGSIEARAVVGADGAKSAVRRWMKLPPRSSPPAVSRLLEVLTPEDGQISGEFRENFVLFDFTPLDKGVQGYAWDFPSYVDGRATMNRGIFDSRILPQRPRAGLVPALAAHLAARGRTLADGELQGHPERYYERAGVHARPHMVLAGDAAGVDPLFGEGIAPALHYGPVVAEALRVAFDRGDFSFATYGDRLAASGVGRMLATRVRVARFCYGRSPRFVRLAWPLLGPVGRYLLWREGRLLR